MKFYLFSTFLVIFISFLIGCVIMIQTPKDNNSFGQNNIIVTNVNNIENTSNADIFFEKVTWFLFYFLVFCVLIVNIILRTKIMS